MQATSKGDVLEILRNLAATCLHRHSVEVVANFQVKCWELKRSVHRFCPIPRYSRERYYRVVLYESNNNQSIISTSILFLYLFLSYKILIILTNWSDDLINFPKKEKGKNILSKRGTQRYYLRSFESKRKTWKKEAEFIPRLKTPDWNSRIKIVSPFSLLFFWNPRRYEKIIDLKWDRKVNSTRSSLLLNCSGKQFGFCHLGESGHGLPIRTCVSLENRSPSFPAVRNSLCRIFDELCIRCTVQWWTRNFPKTENPTPPLSIKFAIKFLPTLRIPSSFAVISKFDQKNTVPTPFLQPFQFNFTLLFTYSLRGNICKWSIKFRGNTWNWNKFITRLLNWWTLWKMKTFVFVILL